MYLSHLSLTNFRNFRQLELDLPPGVVVLFGRNAQGKTSIMEAIYLMAIAKSCRADNDQEMINWDAVGEDGNALVAGTIEKQGERVRVYIGYRCVPTPETAARPLQGPARPLGVRREIKVSRLKRTAAELVGVVNVVLFTAEDLQLVQGPPSMRRRYLDILLSQVDPAYLGALQRYQRVLHQRNRLLRLLQERRADRDELTFWNDELVREGSRITAGRYQAMALLSPLCQGRHAELTAESESLAIEYRPNVIAHHQAYSSEQIEQEFMGALEASSARELGLGSTVVGPHRDDFRLLVNNVDMGTYASRGQARTLALTLRLAEAAYLASMREEAPVVLLDDVLSELDSFRRDRVIDKATQYEQVIITTTDVESFRKGPIANATTFELEGGAVFASGPSTHSPLAPRL